MTKNKRITVSLPPRLEQMLYELRKTDQFCRMSYSEILQTLFDQGASAILNPAPAPPEPLTEEKREWLEHKAKLQAEMAKILARGR